MKLKEEVASILWGHLLGLLDDAKYFDGDEIAKEVIAKVYNHVDEEFKDAEDVIITDEHLYLLKKSFQLTN